MNARFKGILTSGCGLGAFLIASKLTQPTNHLMFDLVLTVLGLTGVWFLIAGLVVMGEVES